METMKPTTSVANDVLHNESHSKLSTEEIAKAVAHHKKHHPGGAQKAMAAKPAGGKKHK